VPAASGAGDGARLHPRAGGGCHHRQEGPAHQAALPVRKCLHQGRVALVGTPPLPASPRAGSFLAGNTTRKAQVVGLGAQSCGAGWEGTGASLPEVLPAAATISLPPPDCPSRDAGLQSAHGRHHGPSRSSVQGSPCAAITVGDSGCPSPPPYGAGRDGAGW